VQLSSHEKTVVEQTVHSSSKRGEEYNKLMQIIERRNQEWAYGSKKRMIFMCWRHAVKQQKAFLLCVENVLTRSMQYKGFHSINQRSKDIVYTARVNRTLKKLYARMTYCSCNTAMTKWKRVLLSKVENQRGSVHNELTTKAQ
jgi:hypothetical protein